MTTSRRKYSPGLVEQFTLAGQRLGLDLAGLFEEDEEAGDGSSFGPDGFIPTFNTSMMSKSRGNVLSYQPAARATSTTDFALTPEQATLSGGDGGDGGSDGGGGGGGTTPEPEPSGPPAYYDELRQLAGQYGQSSLFGTQDYIKAKEQGYTDDQIKEYLGDNSDMLSDNNRQGKVGGLYEQINRGQVDTSQAITRDFATRNLSFTPTEEGSQAFRNARAYENAPQISTAFGTNSKYFGDEDYDAAKASGYSDSDIKNFLSSRLELVRGSDNTPGGAGRIGQLLKDFAPPSGGGGGGNSGGGGGGNYNAISTGAGASSDYFGHKDVEAAKARGASNQDIARYIARNMDKVRGTNVPGGGGLYDEYRQYM